MDADFLPPPATKLVVTQYLEADPEVPYWAWIIVGAFYDRADNIIWSSRIFVGHLNVILESEGEEAQSSASSEDSDELSEAHLERGQYIIEPLTQCSPTLLCNASRPSRLTFII